MRDLKAGESPAENHLARWWEPEPADKVHCYLCPRHCHIGPGQAGFCFIRANEGGKLYSLGYAHPAALQIDPIGKKPLNHFLPGTKVFSMGTAGCNMGCFFCQNWDISKSRSDQVHSTYMPPEDVVQLAIHHGCPSIAFTYNEPTIWGEYVIDICQAAKEYGIKTVMVSNGYITYDAFHDIYDHIDAANIDLKAFTENFYGRTTLTHLQPVLDTLKWLKNETNVWFEITNLLIPTLNDAPAETRALSEWILENLGPDVPLHFTAFHPDFKLRDKPRTPAETLHGARAIAREVGLHYVYEGNIRSDGAHTSCPSCKSLLIRRSWHDVTENRLALHEPSWEEESLRRVAPHDRLAARREPDTQTNWQHPTTELDPRGTMEGPVLKAAHSQDPSLASDARRSHGKPSGPPAYSQNSYPDFDGSPMPNAPRPQEVGTQISTPRFDCSRLTETAPLGPLYSQSARSPLAGQTPPRQPYPQDPSRQYKAATCPDCAFDIPGRWSIASLNPNPVLEGVSQRNQIGPDAGPASDDPRFEDADRPRANHKSSAITPLPSYDHLNL